MYYKHGNELDAPSILICAPIHVHVLYLVLLFVILYCRAQGNLASIMFGR